MKKINQFLISLLLIAILINPVLGFPGMGGNTSVATTGNTTQNSQEKIDLINTTQSDQDIEISSHLIEVEADRPDLQDKLFVRETIVFRNAGTKIFSGALKTWVPDGALEIQVMKAQMVAETEVQPTVIEKNGNIISWQEYIKTNNVPMYTIEYLISAEPKGSITDSKYYSKKLLYPTLINYRYFPTPGYPLFILKVSKSKDRSISILDENRNKIVSKDVNEEDSSILYRFSEIQFKELNIEVSKSAIDLSQIAIYLIIGLLIIIVLAYPVIRKKSPKFMEFEAKIKSSLKRETRSEKQQEAEEEISDEEDVSEQEHEGEEEDAKKSELAAKLEELEKDYASGNLIDEEYEELRNSYQEQLKKINRRNK